MSCGVGMGAGRIPSIASSAAARPPLCLNEKLPLPQPPSNLGPQHRGDDGSSGYGSPDSETFETPQAQ